MSQKFRTTNWSLVLEAAQKDTPQGLEALARLCETYWYPLYAFIRRKGYDVEEASDLTQSFFVRLLEKNYLRDVRPEAGRFRSFLLTSLKHFMANEWDRSRALKRGGDTIPISLDTGLAESQYQKEPSDELTPEKMFEKRWAMTVLELVLAQLRAELTKAGKTEQFEKLGTYLTGERPSVPYKQAAESLGTSEGAVKVEVHRMRRRFGELLHDEIAQTVTSPDHVKGEIRHLLSRIA